MTEYLVGRHLELSDAQLEALTFDELTPTARKVLADSNLPYMDTLLNGTPEEVHDIQMELLKQELGTPTEKPASASETDEARTQLAEMKEV